MANNTYINNSGNANSGYNYPLSPWAARFGVSPDPSWSGLKGQEHSGLAPALPELDPRYYAEEGPAGSNQQPFSVPSKEDIDYMFTSEAEQVLQYFGFRTWELASLNETLYGDLSGGHRRLGDAQKEQRDASAFEQGRLVVDETKWLPLAPQGQLVAT
ncbi:hypothetical protein PG993_003761 [Apiospora rasikravindrae]|uniref:Uncharacterized protein n=1 Tax=Apiospora rasikravindrae TaxID=990691 RepID=A0ABR1U0E9_9PEZI